MVVVAGTLRCVSCVIVIVIVAAAVVELVFASMKASNYFSYGTIIITVTITRIQASCCNRNLILIIERVDVVSEVSISGTKKKRHMVVVLLLMVRWCSINTSSNTGTRTSRVKCITCITCTTSTCTTSSSKEQEECGGCNLNKIRNVDHFSFSTRLPHKVHLVS